MSWLVSLGWFGAGVCVGLLSSAKAFRVHVNRAFQRLYQHLGPKNVAAQAGDDINLGIHPNLALIVQGSSTKLNLQGVAAMPDSEDFVKIHNLVGHFGNSAISNGEASAFQPEVEGFVNCAAQEEKGA